MWKYVSRRLRETYDRFSNVLDIHKTWSCGAQQVGPASLDNEHAGSVSSKKRCEISKCPTVQLLLCNKKAGTGSSKNSGSKDQHRRKVRDGEDPLQSEFLGAIKWSGAIVFGWYASHLLCLHHRQYGRQERGYLSKIYNIPSKALHTNVRSYFASASPVRPSILSENTLLEHYSFSGSSNPSSTNFESGFKDEKTRVFEVNNDSGHGSDDATKQDQSVRDAVTDLVAYLGELEFKFGVQSIAAGDFPSAVAHLQQATGHRHPGATFNLGICYEKGLGVRKNLKLAMECYQKASALGHSKAMYNLGVFYAQGLGGLPKNQGAAEQCFITAAKLGQSEARDALKMKEQSQVTGQKRPFMDKTTLECDSVFV